MADEVVYSREVTMTAGRISKWFGVAVVAAMLVTPTTPGACADEVWDQYPKDENRATGAPVGALEGCCCFPKLHPTATDAFDCKAGMVEFDCKAECAQLKEGRAPSGCKWTKGDCPR